MKITLYISQAVFERIKSGALADDVSQSAYVNKLLEGALNEDNGTAPKLENEVAMLKSELKHKDEIIQIKDSEIKRLENVAGYYGNQSTKTIEMLSGISETLAKLLPLPVGRDGVEVDVEAETTGKRVEIKQQEAKSHTFLDKLLRRSVKVK